MASLVLFGTGTADTTYKINSLLLKKLDIDISGEKPLHCLRKTRISFWLFEKGLHPHEASKLARHSIKQMEWYYKSAKYSKIEQIDID